ncbi:orange carotenoid protein N-terminal domain-containing protein [Aerosakkonemataceae cyanobacterium BLCC-F154]|uniref:Orange carotenoid protein N-terminal domain-containing protein n=1 Tax=Floridaenema fluviatile BLCC-F154 TaxID=3153640 RepID=A0ABV4YFD8_9CYAN
MTFTQANVEQAVDALRRLNADDQLAILWFVYEEMKGSITPDPKAGLEISQAIVDRIQQMSRDEQLQAQRDIVTGTHNDITQQYSALNPRAKLGVWYILAQGMENQTIVPMPNNYKLSSEAQKVLNQAKQLDFEHQTSFLSSAVNKMC